MDHGGAAGIAQHGFDLCGFAACDARGFLAVIAADAARDLAARRSDDGNRVAAMKGALASRDARGQQALAGMERAFGACIDDEAAGRLELAGNPCLACGHRSA